MDSLRGQPKIDEQVQYVCRLLYYAQRVSLVVVVLLDYEDDVDRIKYPTSYHYCMCNNRNLEHNLNEFKASFADSPSSPSPPRSDSTSSLLSKIKKGHFYA